MISNNKILCETRELSFFLQGGRPVPSCVTNYKLGARQANVESGLPEREQMFRVGTSVRRTDAHRSRMPLAMLL